ncbi:Uncharacterised protein [Salmonella enterica subsp. enterica serovar Bovismorbificans]|uniref:Uncharacterized protein n=1 Tax=Salmonella enterica subsp. enterica serovar Bovismorbificans TaxID=58097 RepID=A0A655EAJ7_SALET|nr:Uncharacterised protein [Salmonella enterica subsp. enterica serovar Bovismorbificans]CNU52239.1 Uncharacterised protein [Salmonella enterica subsp. enterica serovar Bovismorbificans]CNV09582.1 Uncharacterised protein [Salmonella enterica subsp. enterica serovar Bovismorbificans]
MIFQIINHGSQHFRLNTSKLADQELHAVEIDRFTGKICTLLRCGLVLQLLQLFFQLTCTFQHGAHFVAQILAVALQQMRNIV